MSLENHYEYGKFDKLLHWLIAINITATLIFAYGMSSLPDNLKLIEYGYHGLSVTSIFLFMTIRLFWRIKQGFPLLPASMKAWQKFSAKLVHYFLYIAIFAQITVGIFLASTTKEEFIAAIYQINYTQFNLVPDHLYDTLLSIHIGIYYTIIFLITVHISAALKHHYVDKDNILLRMLPFVKKE